MRRALTIGVMVWALIQASASAALAGGRPGTETSPGLAVGLALGAVVILGLLLWGAFRIGTPPGGPEGPKR
jgi:hypothetical protein